MVHGAETLVEKRERKPRRARPHADAHAGSPWARPGARTHTARPTSTTKIMQDAKQDLIDRILAVRSSTNTVHIVEETLASQQLSFGFDARALLMHAVFDHGNRPGGQLPIACSLATSASSPRDCACRIIFASGSSSTTASVRGTDSRASSEHDAAALTIGVDA